MRTADLISYLDEHKRRCKECRRVTGEIATLQYLCLEGLEMFRKIEKQRRAT